MEDTKHVTNSSFQQILEMSWPTLLEATFIIHKILATQGLTSHNNFPMFWMKENYRKLMYKSHQMNQLMDHCKSA